MIKKNYDVALVNEQRLKQKSDQESSYQHSRNEIFIMKSTQMGVCGKHQLYKYD